jgi:hypothetical protein
MTNPRASGLAGPKFVPKESKSRKLCPGELEPGADALVGLVAGFGVGAGGAVVGLDTGYWLVTGVGTGVIGGRPVPLELEELPVGAPDAEPATVVVDGDCVTASQLPSGWSRTTRSDGLVGKMATPSPPVDGKPETSNWYELSVESGVAVTGVEQS